MYKNEVLDWIELYSDHIDKAYSHIEGYFNDLHIKDKLDDIIAELPKFYATSFDWTMPTVSMITGLFTLAEREIKNKYPNAIVTWKIPHLDGYDADFDVDDDTLKLAEKLYEEEYE